MTTPIALVAGVALSVVGLLAGFAVTGPADPALAPESSALEQTVADSLAQLGLDPEQAERIDALRAREARRLEALERALADTEDSLRRAELEVPFDAVRVNELVARQAELLGLLRGTESRVVAEIATLLDPAQQRRFAELRSAGSTSGSGVSRTTPAEPASEEARGLRI